MSTLIEELVGRSREESKVRAVLKRSLAFDPGIYPPAFPYIEHRLKSDDDEWKRKVYYLVAGLWAMHWRDRKGEFLIPIAKAAALYDLERRKKISQNDRRKLTSTESRFVALIDSDSEQLPYRLRQMVALLKEYEIDFNKLSKDLLSWNDLDKSVQIQWAREFYNQAAEKNETKTTDKENAQ
jgi:CRISPR system Cascade subunit CasB